MFQSSDLSLWEGYFSVEEKNERVGSFGKLPTRLAAEQDYGKRFYLRYGLSQLL